LFPVVSLIVTVTKHPHLIIAMLDESDGNIDINQTMMGDAVIYMNVMGDVDIYLGVMGYVLSNGR